MKTRLAKSKAVRHVPISQYVSPNDGKTYNYPYGRHNLQETTAASLITLAEHYETMAKYFRELAAKAEGKLP